MALGVDRTGGSAKHLCAELACHRRAQGVANELTAPPGTGESVDVGDEIIVQLYVHTHV